MLVLALDTATPLVSAVVVRVLLPHVLVDAIDPAAAGAAPDPVTLLSQQTVDDAFGHAEHLMPTVLAALDEAGVDRAELDAIVVGLGPGPFTGLRVGIVTAAALGDGLDRPVYGVGSHDGLAQSIRSLPGPCLVVTDARRREIYLSAYDGAARRIHGPAVLAPAALPELIAGLPTPPVAIAGPGAGLTGLQLPVVDLGPAALGLVRAAGPSLVTGAVPGPLTPLYLRRPDVSEPSAAKSVLT
jgi:tRNA threonylcarbamoyl adenosine modification protein YeaZ